MGAIIYALRQFKPYICMTEIILHSDHKPLTFLLNKSKTHDNLARWMIELQSYNIKVVHIKGEKNTVADALSRVFEEKGETAPSVEELKDIIEFPVSLACTDPKTSSLAPPFPKEQKSDSFLNLVWQIKTNQPLKPSTDERTKLEASEMASKTMLSKFINIKQEDWDLFVPCVAFCYNTTINEAT
ncbi:hypothetical protein ANCCEY_15764, partial [Ancylostoma ceylanicum]